MGKSAWSSAILFGLLAGVAVLQATAQTPAVPQEIAERVLDEDTTLEFVDTPLDDVLKFLADYHKLKIELDPETTKDPLAAELAKPVTKNIKQVSLRSALHLLLDPYGLEVTLTPHGSVLLVRSTPELRAKRVESKLQKSVRAKLAGKLKTERVSLEFVDCPLSDVIAWVCDACDCTIVFDHQVLKAGLARTEPLTISRQEQPLREALRDILLPLDLRATIQDEVFLITPRDPAIKEKPSAEVAKALATKLDVNLTATFSGVAMHLTEATGVPFLLHSKAFKGKEIDMKNSFVVKQKQATPLQILQSVPTGVPLKLIERDGAVLISTEAKK